MGMRTLFVTVFAVPYCFFSTQVLAGNMTGNKGPSEISTTLAVDYMTGDYGTGITSDTVTVKFTLGWYPSALIDLSIEIPYIYQSNSLTTSFGTGRYRTSRIQQGGTSPGPRRSGSSSFAVSFDVNKSQSGIGDLILRGGYVVLNESAFAPRIRPEVYIKFPTASDKHGLGTGEFDIGIGLTLDKWLGNWNCYLENVYNFIGNSPDYSLNDYFGYEAGVGYQLTDRLLPHFIVKGSTNPSSDSKPCLELRVKTIYSITGRLSTEAYMGKGFTDGTPDFTAGAAISYQF